MLSVISRQTVFVMTLLRTLAILCASLLASLPARGGAEALELVMVEQSGCAYCAMWNRDIAPIYPRTDVGAAAPLRRLDLGAQVPDDLSFDLPTVFTPTFILVADGVEIGRITGYPGEDFFWGLLEQMLVDHGTLPGQGAG
ncbi:MAG: regulatory protein SoxS [Rhodobacteraceae bacterium HLUCCA08]|nr:MAG: regulatory protein SoxS [Rhodobacteraceae bacterium HLUCCA08]